MALNPAMRMHVGMAKTLLMRYIEDEGPDWLEGFTGTKEEAIALLKADPREFIPIGPCDNQSEKGECLGHPL